jgi:hypothetical protein
MASKNVSKKLMDSSSKIAKLAELMLNEEGHDMGVAEFHFTPKNAGANTGNVVCRFVLKNGKRILVCTKE